ncbi:MAG: AI-2E family transporter [Candidatus Yanofskybacteria bacterium]|nr:AI-2E family transporter [Candidatus Yanofskybacteria bacterium]
MTERQQVDISAASVFRALLVVVAFFLLYLLSDVLIILLFSIVVASAVSPFVTWFQRKGSPRLVAVIVLYLMVLAVGVVISSLVLPSVASDFSQLTTYLPKLASELSVSLDTVQKDAPRYFDFVSEIQNILEVLSGYLQQFSQSALNLVVGAFGGIFSFVAIVVISFYLSVMKNGIENFLAAVVPERYEEYVVDLWRRAEVKVGLWLQGQLLLALIVGLLVYVGLALLGVRFALVFALLAMILEIVPIAGPVLASIPAIGMAFMQEPVLGLWTLVLYVVVQQFENHVLVPLVLGKTTGLNPVVVILSILIGAQLAGIAGALLGVPVATIIVEILDDMARLKSSRRTS